MEKFRKKYDWKSVEDDINYMSKEAKSFVAAFRNMLKRELEPKGVEIVSCKAGHYFLSGFVRKGEQYIYFNYNIPRYGKPINFDAVSAMEGVMYRTAKDDKDFRGGFNNYCTITELPSSIMRLFERMERMGLSA